MAKITLHQKRVQTVHFQWGIAFLNVCLLDCCHHLCIQNSNTFDGWPQLPYLANFTLICSDLTLDSLLCNQLLKRMSKAEWISLENVSFLTVGSGALSRLARYSKMLSLKWHRAGGTETQQREQEIRESGKLCDENTVRGSKVVNGWRERFKSFRKRVNIL